MNRSIPRIPATIEQVAAAAGVSRSTVSRVVNGSTAVSPAALESVRRAIDDLDYVPNRAARSLARRQTHAIALVVPEDFSKFFGDPYFASIASGIHSRLASSDYVLNLFVATEESGRKAASYLLSGNADGAIVVSHHASDSYLDVLQSSVPVVFGGRPGRGHDHTFYVDVDNVSAARVATEHLIERGRTKIATITGVPDMAVSVDRLTGYREAMAAAGLTEHAIEGGDFTERGGADAMRRILASGAAPDALFVQSDLMAQGAMRVLTAAGLVVPDDVSIVAFDDSPVATSVTPQLTTMRQPSFEQGGLMASMLIDLINGLDVPTVTVLDTELIVRESS